MVDGVGGALPIPGSGLRRGRCGAGIAVVERVGAAGDLDAQGFAGGEDPGGRFEVELPLVWGVRSVGGAEEVGAARCADTDEVGVGVRAEADEFDDEVGERCGSPGVKGDLRGAEDMERCGERSGGVGEEIVA